MITREQVKAARAVRGWGVRKLAELSGVAYTSISRFENGADSRGETLRRIQRTLEAEGFEFLDSGRPGIRWDADAPIRWAQGSTQEP